jgi:hypothetical protein
MGAEQSRPASDTPETLDRYLNIVREVFDGFDERAEQMEWSKAEAARLRDRDHFDVFLPVFCFCTVSKERGYILYSDKGPAIDRLVEAGFGGSKGLRPAVFEIHCGKSRKGGWIIPRLGNFNGAVQLLDEAGNPVETGSYEVKSNGMEMMSARVGANGWCDLSPYGEAMPIGPSAFLSDIQLYLPETVARIRYLTLSFPNQENVAFRFNYAFLPHRSVAWDSGCLFRGPDAHLRPSPDRDYYHRSRHPLAPCADLDCGRSGGCERFRLAVVKIQRAVRHWLYNPVDGLEFRRAMARFETAAASASST